MWSSILELSLSLREGDISLREIATYSVIYISYASLARELYLIFPCSRASCWTKYTVYVYTTSTGPTYWTTMLKQMLRPWVLFPW
jgi:hypothetical protein